MQKHVLINFPELQLKSKHCRGEDTMAAFRKECFCKGEILNLDVSLL